MGIRHKIAYPQFLLAQNSLKKDQKIYFFTLESYRDFEVNFRSSTALVTLFMSNIVLY